MGDKEVEYHPRFRMILHTKLANPHYKPEMQAQATLINFTVTRDGLEEQLLAEVVATERPDLEKTKVSETVCTELSIKDITMSSEQSGFCFKCIQRMSKKWLIGTNVFPLAIH